MSKSPYFIHVHILFTYIHVSVVVELQQKFCQKKSIHVDYNGFRIQLWNRYFRHEVAVHGVSPELDCTELDWYTYIHIYIHIIYILWFGMNLICYMYYKILVSLLIQITLCFITSILSHVFVCVFSFFLLYIATCTCIFFL